ncbi:penicillin-binding protein 2 [Candidatus Uhrbacteria bacterium]|nr:penicillin-binding protein 2 [Candidatus Uhrbacteria bacterium]
MSRFARSGEKWKIRGDASLKRLPFFAKGLVFAFVLLSVKLFLLQVVDYDVYNGIASGRQDIFSKLNPVRGEIFVRDRDSAELQPVAANTVVYAIYAEPKDIADPNGAAAKLAPILGLEEEEIADKLNRSGDPYEPLKGKVSDEEAQKIKELGIKGIKWKREVMRVYPEGRLGGHITGFVGEDEGGRKGRYGLEGYFEKELAGTPARIASQKSGLGGLLGAGRKPVFARDGSDLVLTLDRTIQFVACDKLRQAVERHSADGGTVIIMEPETGAILAMCSYPDYDPNKFGEVENVSVFNNPAIFFQYEPGSVFKPITMAAAVDAGKVSVDTAYTDTGSVKIGPHEIKNSDGKANGVQTMAQVLQNSLNTGAVFAMRQLDDGEFRRYVKAFGFGEETGIEMMSEVAGDISSLSKRGEIYAATASFGQGIAVTPLQMVAAFAALGNGGKLMRPYIVDEIRRSDGTIIKTAPKETARVISPRASAIISNMLVSVVENGHGKRAGVPGYFVAGKTGTAQIPKAGGGGYEKDATIGSFAGFAPLKNPKFVMLARVDHPRDVEWAESTAAPLFGEIAKFLLQYMNVPPDRE